MTINLTSLITDMTTGTVLSFLNPTQSNTNGVNYSTPTALSDGVSISFAIDNY